MSLRALTAMTVLMSEKQPSAPKLSQVEKSVIIRALNEEIASERRYATLNPDLAAYAERNIEFREGLINKIESL